MSTQITVFKGADLDIKGTITDTDISGATIELDVIPEEGGAAVISLNSTDHSAKISGSDAGVLEANLSSSDMDIAAGTYLAQFRVTDTASNVQFVPDGGNYIILIVRDSVFA